MSALLAHSVNKVNVRVENLAGNLITLSPRAKGDHGLTTMNWCAWHCPVVYHHGVGRPNKKCPPSDSLQNYHEGKCESNRRIGVGRVTPFDFSPFRAVLLDLDGTLAQDDHALPGAADLVRRLQAMHKIVGVISNSGAGPLRVQMRLHGMAIEVDAARIYTAAAHAADHVLERFSPEKLGRRVRVFNLSTLAIHDMLDGRVDWVKTGGEPCDVVAVAAPTSQHYSEDRARIALQLARGGAAIVGLCSDRVFPSRRGIEFGSGALTQLLAYAANATPSYCGKPQAEFFTDFCKHLGVNTNECVLIGDNLEADIAGGLNVGISGILTLTGVSRRRDVMMVPENLRPMAIVEDLTQL